MNAAVAGRNTVQKQLSKNACEIRWRVCVCVKAPDWMPQSVTYECAGMSDDPNGALLVLLCVHGMLMDDGLYSTSKHFQLPYSKQFVSNFNRHN